MSKSTSNWLYVLFFLAPSLIGVVAFVMIPTVSSLAVSFTDWNIITAPFFVGIENYIELLSQDTIFWPSLGLTFYYAALSIPLSMVGALLLALAVNQRLRGIVAFRVVYFVPVVTSMVAWAMIWRWLYAKDYGLINLGLQAIGLPQIGWLSDRRWVIPALVVMSVWKGLGYGMVIYLAGLQAIPAHLYEAARIDGANRWQLFWRITMPLLSPTHFFMLVTAVIGSFQVFDSVYLMTRGGPGNASRVYNFYLFQQAFSYRHMGYASAMAWLLFIIIFAITTLQVRFLQRGVTYDLT